MTLLNNSKCIDCEYLIKNINKYNHSYCWELDLKLAYDYPYICVHYKVNVNNTDLPPKHIEEGRL